MNNKPRSITIIFDEENITYPLNMNINCEYLEELMTSLFDIDSSSTKLDIYHKECLLNNEVNKKKVLKEIFNNEKEITLRLKSKLIKNNENLAAKKYYEEINKIQNSKIFLFYFKNSAEKELILDEIEILKKDAALMISQIENKSNDVLNQIFDMKNIQKIDKNGKIISNNCNQILSNMANNDSNILLKSISRYNPFLICNDFKNSIFKLIFGFLHKCSEYRLTSYPLLLKITYKILLMNFYQL